MRKTLHRLATRATRRPHALAAAAALALWPAAGAWALTPAGVSWTQWTSAAPGTVVGTMAPDASDTPVTVTFSGDYYSAVPRTLPEPYWGPDRTYTGGPAGPIRNAPLRADGGIFIAGGPGRMVVSFSQEVTNPVLAIASLGLLNADRSVRIQTAMWFEQDYELLTNGPNYFASGQFEPFSAVSPRQLHGAESSGVIRFNGTFSEIAWTSPLREVNDFGNLVGTYLFSVGAAGCIDFELKPNPLAQNSRIRAGCSAYTLGSYVQGAALEVAGSLRADGPYQVAGPLTVAVGGQFTASQSLALPASQALALSGTLQVAGGTHIAGLLDTASGSLWRSGGLLIDPGGEAMVRGGAVLNGLSSVNGSLRIAPGGSVLVHGPMLVGGAQAMLDVMGDFARGGTLTLSGAGLQANSGATVTVAGTLNSAGGLRLENATLKTGPEGQLNAGAEVLLDGAVVNQGTLLLAGAQVATGFNAVVTNQGAWLLRNSTSSFADGLVNNVAGGRIEVEGGLLSLAGASVNNLATLAVSVGGQLQVAGSHLNNVGQIEVGAGSLFELTLGSVANSGQVMVLGGFSNQAQFVNSGDFISRPGTPATGWSNSGSFTNTGLLSLGSSDIGGYAVNDGVLTNNGTLVVEAGTTLLNNNLLFNNGQLRVDGFFSIDGGVLHQSSTGHTRINGVLRTEGGLVVEGGSLGGSGTLDGSLVLAATASGLPGNSPGTLTVTGDVTLQDGATLALEIVAGDGRHDQLRAGRLIVEPGGVLQLQLAGGLLPSIDQTFDLLLADAFFGDLRPAGLPDGVRLDSYTRAVGGRSQLGWAFTPEAAQQVDSAWFGAANTLQWVNPGELRWADTALGHPDGTLVLGGSLGLRRDASLRAAVLQVDAGGQFFNSSPDVVLGQRLLLAGELVNRGALRLPDAQLSASGRWTNLGGVAVGPSDAGEPGQVVNQGRVQHLAGMWTFEAVAGQAVRWHNQAGASLEVAAPMSGPVSFSNQGQVQIAAGARASGWVDFVQTGGSLVVDGELQLQRLALSAGVLGGRGRIDADATTLAADDEAGADPLVLRPGAQNSDASNGSFGGSLSFAQAVDIGAGTQIQFLISSAQQFGRLVFEQGARFAPGIGLHVVLLDDFRPTEQMLFSIITAGPGMALDGLDTLAYASPVSFEIRSGAAEPGWQVSHYTLSAGPDGLDLQLATQAVPVPEPGTWALWLVGLAGLAAVASRRRHSPLRSISPVLSKRWLPQPVPPSRPRST